MTKLQELIQTLRRCSHPPRYSSGFHSSSPCLASTQPPILSWYLLKYGEAARKCKQLCDKADHTLAAMSVVGHSSSHLFYVTDKCSGTQFLIDTGSDVSVVPPLHTDQFSKPYIVHQYPHMEHDLAHSILDFGESSAGVSSLSVPLLVLIFSTTITC